PLLLLWVSCSLVTWLQLFVVALPAIFWILAEQHRAPRAITTWGIGLFAVLALLLNRAFLGHHIYWLLLSYHTHTLSLLLLLGMVLSRLSLSESSLGNASFEIRGPESQAA